MTDNKLVNSWYDNNKKNKFTITQLDSLAYNHLKTKKVVELDITPITTIEVVYKFMDYLHNNFVEDVSSRLSRGLSEISPKKGLPFGIIFNKYRVCYIDNLINISFGFSDLDSKVEVLDILKNFLDKNITVEESFDTTDIEIQGLGFRVPNVKLFNTIKSIIKEELISYSNLKK